MKMLLLVLGALWVLGCNPGVEMNRLIGLDCRPEIVQANGGYCGKA